MPHPADWNFAAALSTATETTDAVEQVVNELTRRLGDGSPPDLLICFATPHHAGGFDIIQRRIAGSLAPRLLAGVTAEGVIGVRREVEGHAGLSVLAGRLPGAHLRPFSYGEIDWPAVLESPGALKQTIHLDGQEIKAIVMVADPFSTPMAQTLPAIGAAFPGVPLIGGMASGARSPGGNRLLLDGKIASDGAVGIAIGGDLRIDCTVSQGCRPIGKPLVITKSKRHVVQELGGRRALDVVQEMAGQLTEEDRALVETKGLLVGRVINEYKPRFGRGDFLIRSLVDADQDAGYIVIGDPQTRVGQTIQFHVRDRRTAEEDFQLLLEAQKLHGGPAGALLFSCNGRGCRLFERPDADASMIHDALGDLPLAGFFAAGEIGPIGNENFVHGHTASLVVFRPT